MSSRVYRPLAVLVLGLLVGGVLVWFTKEPGDVDPLRGFALIRAHCAEMTAEAQREVGATDSGIIRFAVKRQCAISPTAYAKEFRAFSRCVQKRLGYWKAVPALHRHRITAENRCGNTSFPRKGDIWDDMFTGRVHTTPGGRPIPLCPPAVGQSRSSDPTAWVPCNWWPRGSLQGNPMVPDLEALAEKMSEREQAEVFAFRAVAATGLMNPFGKRSYNFISEDDTTRTNAGWRIGFAASDCMPRKAGAGYTFTCTGLSGEHPETGNPLADTFLTVSLKNKEWTVVGVEGNMLDQEQDRVIGYKSAQREEPSHWEFPAVGTWPTGHGVSFAATALWVGPYPSSAPGSVCELRADNAPIESLGDSRRFSVGRPNREFERAGWSRFIDEIRVADNTEITVHCQQRTLRG